jgi:hypothetical protein
MKSVDLIKIKVTVEYTAKLATHRATLRQVKRTMDFLAVIRVRYCATLSQLKLTVHHHYVTG